MVQYKVCGTLNHLHGLLRSVHILLHNALQICTFITAFAAACVRFCDHVNVAHALALPRKRGTFRTQRDAVRHLLGQRPEVMAYGKRSKAHEGIKTLEKVKITDTGADKQTTMPVTFVDRESEVCRCCSPAALL